MQARKLSRHRATRSTAQPRDSLNERGLRSRNKLKRAARDLLNKRGLGSLRVHDIGRSAGVAAGLFYRYFRDLREIVAEICQDFFTELLSDPALSVECQDRYEWIFRNHCVLVSGFAENPGILACLFGLSGDYAEFDEIWKENAHQWNLKVADFLQRNVTLRHDSAERMGFVLGAMTEGVVYQSLIRRTPDLLEIGRSPDDIAEVISVMWYRAIFLSDPPVKQLRSPGKRLTKPRSASAAKGKQR